MRRRRSSRRCRVDRLSRRCSGMRRAIFSSWPSAADASSLARLLRPYPSKDMLAYRVRPLVNNPRHDVPQCVEAIR